MGVTHFLILSKTPTAPYLRVATTPQGPTLTFKINEYSLATDIAQSQLRPRCPKDLLKNSALVKYLIHYCSLKLLALVFYFRIGQRMLCCKTVHLAEAIVDSVIIL